MAKFNFLYPLAQFQDEITFEGSALFKAPGPQSGTCFHCNEPTEWIDLNFQAYLCSEECERAKWAEYEYDWGLKSKILETIKTGSRIDVPELYRRCLYLWGNQLANNIDFGEINTAIIERWSRGTLEAIKNQAWKGITYKLKRG